MKLALPTDDGKTVASHFGRAQYFLVVEIDGTKEISRKLVENLHGRWHNDERHGAHHGESHRHNHSKAHTNEHHEHRHGHDEVFASLGNIEGVIAVRIGPHMFEELKSKKISVYLVPVSTSIDNAINSFTEGKLKNIVK